MNWFQQQLGRQLSQPSGFWGLLVGKLMNRHNQPMYEATFNLLDPEAGDTLLEIGFGNGAHISQLVEQIQPGRYVGVELSDTMLQAAERANKQAIHLGHVQLLKGNANDLPFDPDTFSKVLTINTIYFWEDPDRILQQVKQVLAPGGSFVVAFNSKEALGRRPFVAEKFRLYDQVEVVHLFEGAGFIDIRTTHKRLNMDDVLVVLGKKATQV